MLFALFCFMLNKKIKNKELFVFNIDLDVMEGEKVIFQQRKTLPTWSTLPGDYFGFQYWNGGPEGWMDIVSQSSHEGREWKEWGSKDVPNMQRPRIFTRFQGRPAQSNDFTACFPDTGCSSIPNKGLLQSAITVSMHSCCGRVRSLPSLWRGREPGLVPDSLAARPQDMTQVLSDPLAKDWKAEVKCLPWLFFYHQAGHEILGFQDILQLPRC